MSMFVYGSSYFVLIGDVHSLGEISRVEEVAGLIPSSMLEQLQRA